jgi:hypothetical protein
MTDTVMVDARVKVTYYFDTVLHIERKAYETLIESEGENFAKPLVEMLRNTNPIGKGVVVESFNEIKPTDIN